MAFIFSAFVLLAGVARAQNFSKCHHYSTDGATSASYTQHRFYDFRSLDTEYQLTSNAFADDWSIQTWGTTPEPSAPIRMQRSIKNVYIQHEKSQGHNSYLALNASRSKDAYSTGEIEFKQQNILHASIRVRARVTGDDGACAGIFTYLDGDNESDIEILTKDPKTQIHYTNQPGSDKDGKSVPDASSVVSLPGGATWTEWNDHRLDWTPGMSAWYVNGELTKTKTYSVPKKPSSIILNMWGNGGSWTGEMADGHSASLDVQWIEVVFNTTAPAPGTNRTISHLNSTCNVDSVKKR